METLKVVKIGGNLVDNEEALTSFLTYFSKIKSPKILIHGGGKLATKLAQQMNIDVKIIDGRRITDAKTLDIATMVYAGKINTMIVAKLQSSKCNSMGFTGADGNSIVSVKRPVNGVDYGYVGDVIQVNTNMLEILLNNQITPVFCAITYDKNGQLLNTNADTIACELAISFASLFKVHLYYCFEKNGVLYDINDSHSIIEQINEKTYQKLIKEAIITDGMLPKLNNCFHAIHHKVAKVYIGKPEMLFNTTSKFTTIQT